jgi:amidophosphoribosyltransferase
MGADGRGATAPGYCDACFSGEYPIALVDRDGGRGGDQLSFLTQLA